MGSFAGFGYWGGGGPQGGGFGNQNCIRLGSCIPLGGQGSPPCCAAQCPYGGASPGQLPAQPCPADGGFIGTGAPYPPPGTPLPAGTPIACVAIAAM